MIEHFYMFSDLNRGSSTISMDEVFEAWSNPNFKVVAMTDDEYDYLTAMQLMLGAINIVPFKEFHAGYWKTNGYTSLTRYMNGFVFCSSPRFLDYMRNYDGVSKWEQDLKDLVHMDVDDPTWVLSSLSDLR